MVRWITYTSNVKEEIGIIKNKISYSEVAMIAEMRYKGMILSLFPDFILNESNDDSSFWENSEEMGLRSTTRINYEMVSHFSNSLLMLKC